MAKITPTYEQIDAVEMVLNNRFSILTGKPGTGKTFTMILILEEVRKMNWRFELAAPTGKAAKRMMESTGDHAQTIHKLLEPKKSPYGGFYFSRDAENPIDTDLVIVDEASMIDTNLFHSLLSAIDPTQTKLLLIGDPGQLPSVGPGAILRDLLRNEVIARTELTKIHRYAGTLVEACADIHAGRMYIPAKEIDLEAEKPVNLVHVEIGSPDRIQHAIEEIAIVNMANRGFHIENGDVQIISPVNSKGPLSCEAINKRMQFRLNNEGEHQPYERLSFRNGDKVINTKNKEYNDVKKKGGSSVVNGDIGIMIDVDFDDGSSYVVEFEDPTRTVIIEKAKHHLLHAWCITCHRFQGSEAPVIIIPVHTSFCYFATRKWIYTAISRASKICITVGQLSAIEKMVRNVSSVKRETGLFDFMEDAMSGEFEIDEMFAGI